MKSADLVLLFMRSRVLQRQQVIKTNYRDNLISTQCPTIVSSNTYIPGGENLFQQSIKILLLGTEVALILGLEAKLSVLHHFGIEMSICKKNVHVVPLFCLILATGGERIRLLRTLAIVKDPKHTSKFLYLCK